MNVIVIGGGIIGVSTVFRLAQAGAAVTLLEARELASGTSGSSFAWMNANNKAPIAYHRLNVGGMSEHHLLGQELGESPWLHVHGNVIWEQASGASETDEPAVPVTGESLRAKVRRLREWNYPVEILSAAEVPALQPGLQAQGDVDRFAFFPSEGHIDVPLLVAHLTMAARRHGADIRTDHEVIEILQDGDRVVGVRTARGDRFDADLVVSCVGRWSDQVAALAGATLPMAPTLGLLVISSPVPTTLRSLVHSPGVNIRPDGGSRLLMASFEIDRQLKADTSRETLDDFAAEILDRAQGVLPDLHGSVVETIRVGTRALPADGFPVVGAIPGLDGFYVIATHSGVTMGPLLGRIAAREILRGEIDERIAPFRPDRLLVG